MIIEFNWIVLNYIELNWIEYSQNVGDDADTPEVSGWGDGLLGGHFRRTEFWGSVLDDQLPVRVVEAREAEIDHLDLVRWLRCEENILRLQQIKTKNVWLIDRLID